MYSYGSSGRAKGKQGHGGRDYRPPSDRRDGTSHGALPPPPLKQCQCLIEISLEQYVAPVPITPSQSSPSQGRRHTVFGGRKQADECVRAIRSIYSCHLEIPGRNKAGPVCVVGATIRNVIPACHYLVQMLTVKHSRATIHPNVKLGQTPIEGTLVKIENQLGVIFESEVYSVASCLVDSPSKLEGLSACLDNFYFQNGNVDLAIFMSLDVAYAAGPTEQILELVREIEQALTSV